MEVPFIKSKQIYIPGVIKTGLANPAFCNFSQLPVSNSFFIVLFAYVVFFWLFCG